MTILSELSFYSLKATFRYHSKDKLKKKKNTIKILICLIFILSAGKSESRSYYLSQSGNDNNSGLSSDLAWKTIDKLNSMMKKFLPGDEILFERGSYFTGQIKITVSGDNENALRFGAYGDGKNPVISGSVPVKNWSLYEGKIYKASVEYSVNNLFLNGKQMVLSRYPNSGYLTIDEPLSNPNKGFFDDELNESKGYWNGAIVRMRTINWAFEYSPVKSFSNGNLNFLNETLYPALPGWGYYLDNNFTILDTAGEWYCEETGDKLKTLYFYLHGDININDAQIEASVFDYGFYSVKNTVNLIINDLEIKNQSIAGILLSGKNSQVRIENCTFRGQLQQGINFTKSSENCVIDNCRFYDINGNAINVIKSTGGIFSKNVARNIGLVPGYGLTGTPFTMTAIAIRNSDSNRIIENNLSLIGHGGINNTGRGNLIEKNVISNSMLLLNDGAAIKSYGHNSKYSEWRNNFVFNVPGSREGADGIRNELKAHGLYLDEYCSNNTLFNNTITGASSSAINLYNGCQENLIKDNVCYGNEFGIRFYQGEELMTENQIINNIFFGLNSNQLAVCYRAGSEDFRPAIFKDNYYANPGTEDIYLYQIMARKSFYNLSEWKSLMGNNISEGAKLLLQSEVKFSKLFCNMSGDILTIPLDPNITYKDLNMNIQQGSITIQPWSSVILLTSADIASSPEINIAGGPLVFNNNELYTNQWYNVIGNNLTQVLTITAPDGFEISFDNDGNFSKSMTVNPEGGKINKIIFVKFASETDIDYDNFISNQSGTVNSIIKIKAN